jgi:hypothetical protein
MNYIFLARRENVKNYAAYNDKIAFLLNDGSFFYNNENFGKAVESFFFQGIFLYYSVDGVSTTIMNTNTGEKKYIPNIFNAGTVQNNTFLIGNNYERFGNTLFYSAKISLYEINPYRLMKILPQRYIFSQFIRNGNLLFTEKLKTTLSSLSLLTGEYEWEIDLESKLGIYDGIRKIYGIVNNCLWVVTERGVLLGINVNDGMLIHHLNFDGYDTFQQYGTVQMQYFRSLFDEKQQMLIGVYENRYWEIDLKADKPTLQTTDIKALNPSYFNNPSFIYEVYHLAAPEGIAYDEHCIYFKDNEVSTVGVLNRKTKQIEWHDKLYELPGRSYVMIKDIQVAANKMYVLDEKGVLHIFEKE